MTNGVDNHLANGGNGDFVFVFAHQAFDFRVHFNIVQDETIRVFHLFIQRSDVFFPVDEDGAVFAFEAGALNFGVIEFFARQQSKSVCRNGGFFIGEQNVLAH